jgi:N-acyl-D-aspartate/D-glutamate deacylase
MMGETLIKGGTVIDGTGAPRFEGDVLLSGGKIKEVGKGLSTSGQTVDATGLTVTPGIIDPHTHMDGQFYFEPKGTSSSWHGVTTILMGHCGYSLAPIRPEDREYIIHMFARVEEVAPEIFRDQLPWDWVTFPEYMESMDKGLGINAVSQVGHSTLRYYVMGEESIQREATAAEIESMCKVLHESVSAGAFGFTTSRAPSHSAWNGEPVPSRWAEKEEFIKLAEVLAASKHGTMGLNPRGLFTGMTTDDKEIIWEMTRRSGGKTMQLNGISREENWEFMRQAGTEGVNIYGVVGSQPFYRFFDLDYGTNAFNSMETWYAIMTGSAEERHRLLADESVRPKLREEVDQEPLMDGTKMRRPRLVWEEVRVTGATRPENKKYEGMSIKEIAERQGKHLVDAMLDVAISEDLQTQFVYRFMPESIWLDKSKSSMYNHPNLFPTNSDSGAHLANECKTGEATYFLKHWVLGQGLMGIEEGVRRVTSQAAQWIGIPDRGVLKDGMAADVAVFDMDKLDALPKEKAYDLPNGGFRWIQKASGVEHVWVNGVQTIRHGEEAGELPGKLIRSNAYS